MRQCSKMISDRCKAVGGVWPSDHYKKRSGACKACRTLITRSYLTPKRRQELNKRSYHKNIDARRLQKQQYYQDNKAAFRLRERLRRNRVKIEMTDAEWFEVLQMFGHRCLACGTTEDITMDHIKPISKGGRHHQSNVQPLCRSCNSSKGVKEIDYRAACS